ncbi:MAG: SGNH/GDSL hydrolase family protein [Gammaproteobacteria bacterium]|nr:SGNH/GDSL hydrolase family protein [Gammaproteobacteria bacterium]
MKLKYLSIFFLIGIIITSIELSLEYRAMQKGFYAHFISMFIGEPSNEIKHKDSFPYHSPAVPLKKTPGQIRFWMSSASYALGPSIDGAFPNVFCRTLNSAGESCEMINAGKAGMSINENIKQLENEAIHWQPDYVILYSMSLDIERLSNRFFGSKNSIDTQTENSENIVNKPTPSHLTVDQLIEEQVENTTIYKHLRRYIGGTVLMSSILHDDLTQEADKAFKTTLVKFIETTKSIGATPIFVGFAAKYTKENISKIDYEGTLWLLRYNKYLSPTGWVNTMSRFDKIMQQTAIEHEVVFISDVHNLIAGKTRLYKDFVHFTQAGHKQVGEAIASGFIDAKKTNRL